MKDKTYLVLTPEKIEDIFWDLESKLYGILDIPNCDFETVKEVIEFKKQELLKSIK